MTRRRDEDEMGTTLEELARDGLVERIVVDGEPRYHLSATGFERVERLLRSAGIDPESTREAMSAGDLSLDTFMQALQDGLRPRCFECVHFAKPLVAPGSRRVVGRCRRPGGPKVGDVSNIGDHVYAAWVCDAYEATAERARIHPQLEELDAQNDALNERYSDSRPIDWRCPDGQS